MKRLIVWRHGNTDWNAGLPSLAVTFSVISMPSTSLPPQVLFGSVIRRTSVGLAAASAFSSVS